MKLSEKIKRGLWRISIIGPVISMVVILVNVGALLFDPASVKSRQPVSAQVLPLPPTGFVIENPTPNVFDQFDAKNPGFYRIQNIGIAAMVGALWMIFWSALSWLVRGFMD